MTRGRFLLPFLFVLAAAVAACGGGGGSSKVIPSPAPTATPHAGPTQLPVGPTPQTISLSGGGYTLSFAVPPITTGNTSTMSAVLQTTLPAGTNAPQARKRAIPPRPLASIFSGLVYLVVSTTDNVGFSSAPGFQYTLPTGTTIPSGSNFYVLWWDPYVGSWQTALGPGTVSGLSVSFPAYQTGVELSANQQYVYALAETTQVVPTATPAPTPTPTVAPSSTPGSVPAYCAGFATPTPNPSIPFQKVIFDDESGTGAYAQPVLYLVTGADPNGQTYYLNTKGQLTPFTTGATAPPLPLACFPGSKPNGSGLAFELPPPINGESGNLYIVYATPDPSGGPPNPMPFVGSGMGFTQYTLDWHSSPYEAMPWDMVEYTLPSGTTDVTQIDKVGLPMELTQGSTSVGFSSGAQYQALLNAFQTDPDTDYAKLLVSANLGGHNVLARILSPPSGEDWGFPQDFWYNSTFSGSSLSALNLGYTGYVVQQYQTSPQLYTLNGIAGQSGNYCATYDGVANMQFYSVGSSTTCTPPLTGTPHSFSVLNTLVKDTVDGVDSLSVCQSAIYRMAFGTGNWPQPTDLTAFYLWKAMAIDIARGVALQPGPHPIGGWSTSAGTASFSQFYKDSFYNHYPYYVHQYMINHESYALQYDEPGGLAPAFTADTSQNLKITIWTLPAFSRPTPTATATPLPCPT